jgi:hypothetical protein
MVIEPGGGFGQIFIVARHCGLGPNELDTGTFILFFFELGKHNISGLPLLRNRDVWNLAFLRISYFLMMSQL